MTIDARKQAMHRENVARIAARTCGQYAIAIGILMVIGVYASPPKLPLTAGTLGQWIGTLLMFGFPIWLWSRRNFHLREAKSQAAIAAGGDASQG
jgi:hypothetical protein